MQPSRDIARLLEIMTALRTPQTGCAWDLEQTFASIVPYTIEEAYEVADAVEQGDMVELRDELGDLLLQVVFHARIAEDNNLFDFGAVVEAVTRKLIRRHPHVFGDARNLSPDETKALWNTIKATERAEKPARPARFLDGVPAALPALTRAVKLQAKAATVGFDWDDARLVLAKIREEIDEVAEALVSQDRSAKQDEIGDLLFAVANLARHAGVDPEAALRSGNAKFERRFGFIEQRLEADGKSLKESSLDAMEQLWTEAKTMERADSEPQAGRDTASGRSAAMRA